MTLVVSSSVSTITSLLPDLGDHLNWIKAAPPLLTAIAAGVLGRFYFRSEWVRQGVTLRLLESEYALFKSRADLYLMEDLSARAALLATRVAKLQLEEVYDWRAQSESRNANEDADRQHGGQRRPAIKNDE